mmetsp:Transcript_15980/g.20209  ORF Transcript_15980/g.20209 Transcript_15980/m.20209 type:complete len:113 (-) Transcript_15980:3165-3503(-)
MGKNNRGGGGHGRGGHGGGGRQAGFKNMVRVQQEKLTANVYHKNITMFKDSRAPDAVDVYLNGTVNLLGDLRALTTLKVEETAVVKAVNNESALSDISMIDLRLNVVGPAED